MPLQGRVAIVTGGGRGIGRAIALDLARAGCDVAVASRTGKEVQRVAEEIEAHGRRALAMECDVSSEEDVRRLVADTSRVLGRIGIVVNNAGSVCRKPFSQYSINDWDGVLNSHVRGTFLVSRMAVQDMLDQGWGRIVTISSVAGLVGVPNRAAYCAAKWAQVGFTEALDEELRGTGVRAHVVCPGPVATRMRAEGYPTEVPESLIQPEDVSQQVMNLLQLSETAYVRQVVIHPRQHIRHTPR